MMLRTTKCGIMGDQCKFRQVSRPTRFQLLPEVLPAEREVARSGSMGTIYIFGDWRLDTRLYELRHVGKLLKLEPKVFDVLLYLIQHRDRVVSSRELMERLWPGQFISDAALVRCVVA